MHPQASEILKAVNSAPPFDRMGLEEARRMVQERPRPQETGIAEVRDLVAGPRQVPARLYRPTSGGMLPAIVFAHSGGWIMGSVEGADETCRRLALASGCAVLSVEYRLAPEFPHPAAVEDVLDVLDWISDASVDELDAARLALAGESSGAHIALAAALSRRGSQALRGQLLVCPPIDRNMMSHSWAELGDEFIPRRSQMAWMWDLYLGGDDRPGAGAPDPQTADLASLPPTVLVVAEWDPLRDEALDLSKRLSDARVAVTTIECAGQIHPVFAYAPLIHDCDTHLRNAGRLLGDLLRGGSES